MEIKGQFGKYSEIYREHYKKELIITLCIYTAFSILLLVLFIQSLEAYAWLKTKHIPATSRL